MGEKKIEKRRPLLTARQVGMIAAFGGLGFAWRALGLVVLIPPTTYVLGIRYTLLAIVSFAGGPYVAIASGFLMGLPSAYPLYDCVAFPLIGITIASVSKRAWRWMEEKKHIRAYSLILVAIILAEFIISAPWGAFVIAMFGVAPFWPFFLSTVAGPSIVHILQEFIPLAIVLRTSPEFMRPRWLWSGGEELE